MATSSTRDAGDAVVLLPALGGVLGASPELAALLARADRLPDAESGREAVVSRHLTWRPKGPLPVAALSRLAERGDAEGAVWLRADPGHARADVAALRLLRCGDLDLLPEETASLLRELRPLFGDAGYELSATAPSRWYLRGIATDDWPRLPEPARVIGDDLSRHLPEGPGGAKWRRLLNEAQVLLHQHPVNHGRAARGKLTANTLWFWGGGRLPDAVTCHARVVASDDPVLRVLATRAGAPVTSLADALADPAGALLDAQSAPAFGLLREGLSRLLAGLGAHALVAETLDGARFRWRRRHRWRFWRRPLRPAEAA